jgi:signal peptidase complex subunit 3
MMALLAAIAISSFVFTANPDGDFGSLSVKVYVRERRKRWRVNSSFRYPASGTKKAHAKQEPAFVNFNVTAGSSLH